MKKFLRTSAAFVGLALAATVLFQNCSKVSWETKISFSKNGTNTGQGACQGQNGSTINKAIKIEGPDTLAVQAEGSFNLKVSDNCVQVAKVIWTAGDGYSDAELPNHFLYKHTYRNAGLYLVKALVVDVNLNVLHVQKYVTVTDICLTAPASCPLVVQQYILGGPSTGIVGDSLSYEFQPNDPGLSSKWNWGDTSPVEDGGSNLQHIYTAAGNYEIKVILKTPDGETKEYIKTVLISAPLDPNMCNPGNPQLTGPTRLIKDSTGQYVLTLNECAMTLVQNIKWFIDGVEVAGSGQTLAHKFLAIGFYKLQAKLYLDADAKTTPAVVSTNVYVVDGIKPDDPEDPEDPTCGSLKEGESYVLNGPLQSRKESCEMDGKKTRLFYIKSTYICQGGVLKPGGSSEITISLSGCQGKSCTLPDGSKMTAGQSQVFYSSANAPGLCTDIAQTRICNGDTGALSGDVTFTSLVCNDGCPGFGAEGTVKDEVHGENQVTKVCTYGETGFFDIFEKVITRKCVSGSVVDVSTKNGALKTAAVCPSYEWKETGWSTCSATCGGVSNAIYTCYSGATPVAAGQENRCGVKPVNQKVCSSDPHAVETTTSYDYANSSYVCPANEIGSIIKSREVKNVKTCVNDAWVPSITYGVWTETRYCREIVPYRCSQDSLSPSMAFGRLMWMNKCAAQDSRIRDFFTQTAANPFAPQNVYAATKGAGGGTHKGTGTVSFGRLTYATFLHADGTPWIAPAPGDADWTIDTADESLDLSAYSCAIPNDVYVAAVCTSSCATPDQRIQTDLSNQTGLAFLQAMTKKTQSVVTLTKDSSMGRMSYQQTAVQNWVTELVNSTHMILVFKMESGGQLKLTPNHPVLTESGTMKSAGEWVVGDSMVRADGRLDKVVSIANTKHVGKVYNLFMGNDVPLNNVVITEGYLNGSGFFQNQGADLMNRELFRQRLSKKVK